MKLKTPMLTTVAGSTTITITPSTIQITIQRRWSRHPLLTQAPDSHEPPEPYVAYIWNTYTTLSLGPDGVTLTDFNEFDFWLTIKNPDFWPDCVV